MSLPANTVVEVRSAGSDSNGGGFVAGSSGTDYSQQNSAQYTFTDLASTNGTTNPSVVSSASHNFVAADVGNLIQITAGTNWVTGFYQIVSVASNKATLDRACGSVASLSSGTYAVGGALATPQKAFANFIGSSALSSNLGIVIYIKASTYTTSSGFTTGSSSNELGVVTRIVGYASTRGDGGQATLQAAADNLTLFTLNVPSISNAPYSFENITFDGNNKSGSNGLNLNTAVYRLAFFNCVFKNFTNQFVVSTAGLIPAGFNHCDFINNALTASTAYILVAGTTAAGQFDLDSCYVANNSGSGTLTDVIAPGSGVTALNSIFYNNTGTNFGVIKNTGLLMKNCVFHSNAGSAIDNSSFYTTGATIINAMTIQNCIFTDNGGYGIIFDAPSSSIVIPGIMNNAFYNNTSGNQSGYTSMGNDVTLTGLPYNNVPTDFGLNNTSGEGAACRATAIPGTIGSASVVGTGYLDMGPLQHQCVTGSGGMISQWFGN